ncbi:YfiR family protein [Peristeroidobacter agariperforans]|uniref:YfiR family protein n=1 Tax=Peristeroidobacter agariperforans TaxID=268404 RepID=UPI00101D4E81|nr:YfiR family protein [Peristeroidobacter agariperforans]
MRFLRSVTFVTLLLVGSARADDIAFERADQLRAAYLFNFLKFVELPHASAAAIHVCFIGARGVQHALTTSTVDKRIGMRSIATAELPASGSWSGCDVVYLDAAQDVRTALASAAGNDALTVSEASDFTECGGIIRLFTEDNRLRFAIDVGNARRAGLKISSDLLRLASRVEQ